MNRIVIAAATGLIAITSAVGVAGSANAATPAPTAPKHTHTLAQVQASSAISTDKLIAHLGAVEVRVNANKTLTADQKSTVVAALAADVQAVQTGAAKVAADTTVKDASKDSRETLRAGRAIEREQAKAVRADVKADKKAETTTTN